MLSGAGKNRGAHRTPFQPARGRAVRGPFALRCRDCEEREDTIDALALCVGGLVLAIVILLGGFFVVAC